MEHIWHLAYAADLADARETGMYRVSTRGATLESVGFIHGSYPDQLAGVAAALYADDPEPLVVLVLDAHVLRSCGLEIREEPDPADPTGPAYPHIYGPIPMDAVVAVRPAALAAGELVVGAPA
ncbi:DUF952 domain-containing protein [Georgenia sp. Z1491]|uniref:DUF952 domain-containing protein n=1 Tax=Georgenia sp. Z1491 TaxID=3416707 RepID=UPI003CF7FEA5